MGTGLFIGNLVVEKLAIIGSLSKNVSLLSARDDIDGDDNDDTSFAEIHTSALRDSFSFACSILNDVDDDDDCRSRLVIGV